MSLSRLNSVPGSTMGDGNNLQKYIPSVVFCSSEEAHFPVGELSKPIPSTRGWHSERKCKYPQEIGLRFDGEIYIQQIQILANESKVPSRIDIYACEGGGTTSQQREFPSYEESPFRRLGYVSFHSNATGQYKSGELRSVRVDCKVLFLRLLIWEPFDNPLNFYEQVGLTAIHCVGNLVRSYQPSSSFAHHAASSNVQGSSGTPAPDSTSLRLHSASTVLERLQLDLSFDQVIIDRIKELTFLKQRAMAEDQFDTANSLKQQIETLYPLGAEIQQLESRKRRATLEEDFQLAQILKNDIEELRAKAATLKVNFSPQRLLSLPANHGQGMPYAASQNAGSPMGYQQPQQHRFPPPADQSRPSEAPQPHLELQGSFNSGAEPNRPPSGQYQQSPPPQRHSPPPPPPPPQRQSPPPAQPQPYHGGSAFDEMSAVASGQQLANGGLGGAPSSRPANQRPAAGGGGPTVDSSQLLHFDQVMAQHIHQKAPSQGPPERVQGDDGGFQGYRELVATVGVYATSCLYSKRYQLREAAARVITEMADKLLVHVSADDVLEAITLFLGEAGYGITDSIAAAFMAAAEMLEKILTGQFGGNCEQVLKRYGAGLLDKVASRLGETNTRVSGTCKELLLLASKATGVGPEVVVSNVLLKKGKLYRVVVDQCAVVGEIVEGSTPVQLKESPSLAPEVIFDKLVQPGFTHANKEARERSLDLLMLLRRKFGSDRVEPLINKLKPSQRKLVDERIDKEASGVVEGPASPSPKKSAPRLRRKLAAAQDEDARVNTDPAESPRETTHESDGSPIVEVVESPPPKARPQRQPPQAAVSALPPRRKPPEPVPGECQFCKLADDAFDNHEELVQHFMAECPMLCTCPLCKLPVEIREVHWHLAQDCEHQQRLKQCPRCLEAVRDTDFDDHVAAKSCALFQEDVQVCPLCHEKMPAGDAFWEVHILTPPFCPSNPRTAAPS